MTGEPAPRRVKIFDGGFESNEDYIYVRGRGQCKICTMSLLTVQCYTHSPSCGLVRYVLYQLAIFSEYVLQKKTNNCNIFNSTLPSAGKINEIFRIE
jgi:hypothetical protein